LIRAVQRRKNSGKKSSRKSLYIRFSRGIFIGTFNFNPCANNPFRSFRKNAGKYSKRKVNVLFDTDNNRIFTISDLAKDIMDRSNGESNLPQIIDLLKKNTSSLTVKLNPSARAS